ncbi:DUF5370 family protein [Bacillus pinisoli]|uniref:DUF5370 family protein n=1 Tax=Bacillus pinisoli TaxID=2901866 RepID=UPI001FF37E72|nr:DUF5370 family protein [Bacillus pinisoli]
MGAIERNGYMFETEYSVMQQKGAVHVYKEGQFVKELDFTFHGQSPEPKIIEELIENFFQ